MRIDSEHRHALFALGTVLTINLFARGVSETFAVFLLPLAVEFGWERGTLTSVYAVFMLVTGLSAPIVGVVFDRFGPRWCYSLGMLCYGVGYWMAGSATSLWQLYLYIGVLGGFGTSSIGMVPGSALISRWFRGRLTTAMGIAYAGFGVGVLLLVPITQILIDTHSWRFAYQSLGVLLLIAAPIALLLPWGRLAAGRPAAAIGGVAAGADGGWTLARALRTSAFWGCFGVFFMTSVAVFAVAPQIVAYLIEIGFAPLTAASAFGATSALAVVGMIGVGALADRFGRRIVVTITYFFTIGGTVLLLLLQFMPSTLLLGCFVLVFGIVQGSRGPVVLALAARLFPGRGLGAIYGAITVGMGLGAGSGAWGSGLLHDLTGDYLAGFALGMVAAVMGASLFWLVPGLREPAPPI